MTGYFIYPGLFSLFIVCMVLTDYYWLTFLLAAYFLIRLIYLKKRTVLQISLVIGVLTWAITGLHHYTNQTEILGEPDQFVVEVQADEIKYDGNQIQFYGEVKETNQQKNMSEKVVVFYYAETLEEKEWWQAQQDFDEVLVTGAVSLPENNRNQYQFNYKEYLFQKRIHWVLSAEKLTLITDSTIKGYWQQFSISNLKQELLSHIDENITPKIGNYMKTLLLGDVGSFETDLLKEFKDLGLLHLLSISGLHIQFLFAGLSYLLLRIGTTKEMSYFILVPILFCYANLIGWGISAFRAVVVSFILLTAARFQINISSLDAWAITLFLALIINPYQVYSVGFQLSYLLSLLLVLFSKTFLSSHKSYLKNNLLISFVMTIASVPILIFHFFEFPWIGTIANLIFIPFFSWVLIPLIAYLVVSYFISGTVLFDGLLSVFEQILSFPEWIATNLSKMPFNGIVTGRPSLFWMILFCLALIRWFISLETGKRVGKTSFVVLIIFFIVMQLQTYSPFGEVIMIDVGQGDAILIKEPFGKGNYLIDTGGSISYATEEWTEKKNPSTIASKELIPLLKAKGIRTLDRVFVTHGDADHIQALKELAEEINIEEVVYPAGTEKKELFHETMQFLQQKGVTLTRILAKREGPIKVTSSLYVIWPFEAGEGENGDSLALYGKIGAYTWLFTGDLGIEEEKELLEQFPGLQVDVLKVGHHGSNTSTSEVFVQQLKPQMSLISTKQKNQFGHPHAEVIDLLEREDVQIYRTDLHGAIHYRYLPFQWSDKRSEFVSILDNK